MGSRLDVWLCVSGKKGVGIGWDGMGIGVNYVCTIAQNKESHIPKAKFQRCHLVWSLCVCFVCVGCNFFNDLGRL